VAVGYRNNSKGEVEGFLSNRNIKNPTVLYDRKAHYFSSAVVFKDRALLSPEPYYECLREFVGLKFLNEEMCLIFIGEKAPHNQQ